MASFQINMDMAEYDRIQKKQESRAVANSVAQQKSNVKHSFGFVDNRQVVIAQRKRQKLIKNPSASSHSLMQLEAISATACLSWTVDGTEGWTSKSSDPAPIGPNINALVDSGVVTSTNAASGFVSGHMIAAAMGGANTEDNIVGWDNDSHETPQTCFEHAIYKGGPAAHGFGPLVAPEKSETGLVTINGEIAGKDKVNLITESLVTTLCTHIMNNLATLKGNGRLVRDPKVPKNIFVKDPNEDQIKTAFKSIFSRGNRLGCIARVPSVYSIGYIPTNSTHSNVTGRTSTLNQVSLPTISFNAGATPLQIFNVLKGDAPSIHIAQWILNGV